MEMPMKKASTKLVLLVLGAASLSAALILPVSAQTRPSSSQTCDNKSTARDKVQRPDARCVHATSEKYVEEQAGRLVVFFHANPPTKTTTVPINTPNGITQGTVYDGIGPGGVPYRVVNGATGFAGSGSASGISVDFTNGKGGSGGGRGRTSSR